MKTCFLISPIGKEGSEIRAFADKVRDFLRHEVLAGDCYYDLTRADENITASTITDVMINNIIEDDLVIVLMDYENPNVFYEMAVRHAAGKACFVIISDKYQQSHERHRAFDLKDIPEITFPYDEIMAYVVGNNVTGKLLDFVKRLRAAIKSCEDGKDEILNPIIRARRDFKLPPRETVSSLLDKADSRIDSSIQELKSELMQQLDEWKSGMNDTLAEDIMKKLNNMNVQAIANYIEGENEAFKKLAEMTKQAKYALRTSRFAPQAISETDSETKKEFFEALCDFGKRPGVTCKRIMCMNEKSKEDDLWNTMSRTRGGSMELYLTKRNNNFELVVIDDIAAFLHFYDDTRRIKSTLFITGKSVIHEIEKVYDRILADSDYEFQVIKCADYSTPAEIAKKFSSTIEYFQLP